MSVKKLGNLLFLLMLAIALIGCAADTDTADIPEEKYEDPASETTHGGELNIAYYVQPATLDTHVTTSTDTRDVGRHIYESLVTFNSNYEVEPMLAETFERSEDGKTITFHLREGILFHNGEEMTADDVVASMEKWQENSSVARTYLNGTKYEAKDDYTVIAHIDNPSMLDMHMFADFSQFAAIMPQDIAETAGPEGVDEYIGTGPFKFEEWKQDQYIHLTKYEDYQPRSEVADGLAGEKKALLDDIYFHIVTDPSTRIAGLQTGEYDIASQIPHDNVEMLKSDQNIKLETVEEQFNVIIFNKRQGFFTDKAARQAANAAINVEDVLKGAYGNEEFYSIDHAFVLEEQTDWYTDAGIDKYNTYDPALAKQLLEEAGYDGEEIVIITTREAQGHYETMVVVQQQLEAVGMNVKLEVYDWPTVAERREVEDAYDIYTTVVSSSPTPVQLPIWSAEWSGSGWPDSEEIDRLIKEIQYADSLDEAKQFTAELQEEAWDYLPVIKAGNKKNIDALNKDVNGDSYLSGPILWNTTINE